jgi:hypothetical protein
VDVPLNQARELYEAPLALPSSGQTRSSRGASSTPPTWKPSWRLAWAIASLPASNRRTALTRPGASCAVALFGAAPAPASEDRVAASSGPWLGRRPGAQGRLLLLGKEGVPAHRLARPLAAESDESEQSGPAQRRADCSLLHSTCAAVSARARVRLLGTTSSAPIDLAQTLASPGRSRSLGGCSSRERARP